MTAFLHPPLVCKWPKKLEIQLGTSVPDAPCPNKTHTLSGPESVAALVQINTRLNAIGGASKLTPPSKLLARRASAQLVGEAQRHMSKRSRDSLDACVMMEKPAKKGRMVSNESSNCPLSPVPDPVLVSPVCTAKSSIHSPEAPPPPLFLASTPLRLNETLTIVSTDRLCLSGGPSGHKRNKSNGVKFSDENPQVFFPISVTPDELSADEEEIGTFRQLLPPTTPRPTLSACPP